MTNQWRDQQQSQAERERKVRLALRLQSASGTGAAGWLLAIPNCPMLLIANTPFRLRLRRLLGVPPNYKVPAKCYCNASLERDEMATHFESCTFERVKVHDRLLRTVYDMTTAAGIPTQMEVMGKNELSGCQDEKRLDLVFHGHYGRPNTVGDVTIWHPMSKSMVDKVLKSSTGNTLWSKPGKALEEAEKCKKDKYGALCQNSGYKLEVYAVEHYGRVSKDLLELVQRCFENMEDEWRHDPRWNWSVMSRRQYWLAAISCNLQRSLGLKESKLLWRSWGDDRRLKGTDLDVLEWYNMYESTWDWVEEPGNVCA